MEGNKRHFAYILLFIFYFLNGETQAQKYTCRLCTVNYRASQKLCDARETSQFDNDSHFDRWLLHKFSENKNLLIFVGSLIKRSKYVPFKKKGFSMKSGYFITTWTSKERRLVGLTKN